MGDARNNMGDTLLIGGAILGMDVRLVRPEAARGPRTSSRRWPEIAAESGAQDHGDRGRGGRRAGADFVYTDVWVSMGEPDAVWEERIALLRPYQVNPS